MSRWTAAGIHLLISIAVAAAAVTLMLGVMYPLEYFQASGGFKLLTILLSVDVTLGPLLTLLVFKVGKPSLKFDLTCIALLQLAALIYGLWVVVQARPVFLVHVGDRFHLVRASEMDPELLGLGSEDQFRTLSWTGPRLAVAQMPGDRDRQQELMMSAIAGSDLQNFPETYTDYPSNAAIVLEKTLNTETLISSQPAATDDLQKFLNKSSRAAAGTAVVPLQVGAQFLTALVDRQSAEILGIFPVDPWPPAIR